MTILFSESIVTIIFIYIKFPFYYYFVLFQVHCIQKDYSTRSYFTYDDTTRSKSLSKMLR